MIAVDAARTERHRLRALLLSLQRLLPGPFAPFHPCRLIEIDGLPGWRSPLLGRFSPRPGLFGSRQIFVRTRQRFVRTCQSHRRSGQDREAVLFERWGPIALGNRSGSWRAARAPTLSMRRRNRPPQLARCYLNCRSNLPPRV
jgi:hypothetical protein